MTDANLNLVVGQEGKNATSHECRELDTGLIGLAMLARFHNLAADADQLAHDFRESGKNLTVAQILLAVKQLGLKAQYVRTERKRLQQTPLPALALDTEGHLIILSRIDGEQVLIQAPGSLVRKPCQRRNLPPAGADS